MTEEEYQKRIMTDYREVFAGESGARVLRDICRLSGLFDELESSDPIVMARIMGKQDLAKHICALHGQGIEVLMSALTKGETDGRYRDGTYAGDNGSIASGWIDG